MHGHVPHTAEIVKQRPLRRPDHAPFREPIDQALLPLRGSTNMPTLAAARCASTSPNCRSLNKVMVGSEAKYCSACVASATSLVS
jgi:hypothetical protein